MALPSQRSAIACHCWLVQQCPLAFAMRAGVAIICTAILCSLTGCHWWSTEMASGDGVSDAPRWNPPPPAASASPPHTPAVASKTSQTVAKPGALADPRWIFVADDSANPLSAAPPVDSAAETSGSVLNNRMGGRWRPAAAQADPSRVAPPPDRSHRWRHPGLELLMAQAADARPDLHVALQSSDSVIATNAAILLSRQRDPAALGPLLRAVHSNEANSWQRRAAVEALAEMDQPTVVAELRALLDEHGRFTGDATRGYQPDLHVELLHGLAHAEGSKNAPPLGPDGEPRFVVAIESPAASVRREAVEAFADSRFGPLPANIVRYVGDPDGRVRRAALHTLTVRRHPEALELLRQALLDQDLIVRLSATADMGRLGGPEALGELRKMATQGTELVRAAAVAALVEARDEQIVSIAIADKSWRVRRALVPMLDWAAPTELAERLVADVNPDVAQAAIESIGHWPLKQAGPLLLTAMEGRTYLARKAAAQQLAKLWPPATEFEIEAASRRRAAQMAQLRQKWRDDVSVSMAPDEVVAEVHQRLLPTKNAGPSAMPPEKQLAEVRRLLAKSDKPMTVPAGEHVFNSLVAFGPALPELLRRVEESTGRPLPDYVYTEVLPAASVEFATIQRLASTDVRERREAAEAIKTGGYRSRIGYALTRTPLDRLALERLVQLVTRESDSLVWGSIFGALADDDREPATRLAYSALSHPSPEVRRLACEHLAMHPDPQNAPLLAKSLTDVNAAVVEAAVRALGRLPSLDDPRPLEKILAAEDHALRVEAAEALAHAGVSSGVAALERLAYDAAPKVRRLAAAAMGRIADPSFVPALVHLLDDRPEIARAALESLPRAAGRNLPQTDAVATDSQQNPIQRWKDWYRAGFAAPR